MKKCTKCKEHFPLIRFKKDKSRKDGRSSWCKKCHSKSSCSYQKREENKERINKNKDRYRIKMYGLTEKKYQKLLKNQDNKCKICRKKPDKVLAIDHCHKTGEVRGLLCKKCNSGIGFLKDNPGFMAEALFYLLESESQKNLKYQVLGYIRGRMIKYKNILAK